MYDVGTRLHRMSLSKFTGEPAEAGLQDALGASPRQFTVPNHGDVGNPSDKPPQRDNPLAVLLGHGQAGTLDVFVGAGVRCMRIRDFPGHSLRDDQVSD